MPSSEPSASPSGFSCVVSSSLSALRAARDDLLVSGGDAHRRPPSSSVIRMPAVDRLVVDELERRRPLHSQLAADRLLEEAVRGRQPRQRLARSASSPSTLTYTRAWRRSGLVSTEVTVTKPMRGSFSPRRSVPRGPPGPPRSPCACGRAILVPCRSSCRHDAAFHADVPSGNCARRSARRSAARSSQRGGVAADERGGQPRALPQVVVVGLGHRRAEALLQLRLQRLQLLALALEAAGSGKCRSSSRTQTNATTPASAPPAASRTPRSRRPPSRRGSSRARCRTPCRRRPRARRP